MSRFPWRAYVLFVTLFMVLVCALCLDLKDDTKTSFGIIMFTLALILTCTAIGIRDWKIMRPSKENFNPAFIEDALEIGVPPKRHLIS